MTLLERVDEVQLFGHIDDPGNMFVNREHQGDYHLKKLCAGRRILLDRIEDP